MALATFRAEETPGVTMWPTEWVGPQDPGACRCPRGLAGGEPRLRDFLLEGLGPRGAHFSGWLEAAGRRPTSGAPGSGGGLGCRVERVLYQLPPRRSPRHLRPVSSVCPLGCGCLGPSSAPGPHFEGCSLVGWGPLSGARPCLPPPPSASGPPSCSPHFSGFGARGHREQLGHPATSQPLHFRGWGVRGSRQCTSAGCAEGAFLFFTVEAFLSVRPVSKGESPRSWAGVLAGPVLWPVAGQGPGASSGPGAMTWPFPPGLSAPPWGAGPAPALRPAVYQLSPLLPRASTQLPPSARRCSGSPCVRGAGGPWGQRLPVARPPRPRGPWPSWLPGRVLLHSASPGPFPAPRILRLLSPRTICSWEGFRSFGCPQSGVFGGGG